MLTGERLDKRTVCVCLCICVSSDVVFLPDMSYIHTHILQYINTRQYIFNNVNIALIGSYTQYVNFPNKLTALEIEYYKSEET